ncbi:MAG: hypothetical protein ACXWCZ_00710 [Flavisolibacter sp.]
MIFLSCNNSSQENGNQIQKENKETVDNSTTTNIDGCYWQIMKRDTLVAKLVQNGNNITGKLSFDNYQKDGSTGSVKGVVDGDIIKLWYFFQSEGLNSVMEVWYKKQGDALLRAVGPIDAKGDTSYFTDKTAITFDPSQKLVKADCAVIPSKYK